MLYLIINTFWEIMIDMPQVTSKTEIIDLDLIATNAARDSGWVGGRGCSRKSLRFDTGLIMGVYGGLNEVYRGLNGVDGYVAIA